jgi:hypothetical protein
MAWSVNNDLVKGNNMWLYLVDLGTGGTMTSGMVEDAKVLAYSQSCSFEINSDTLDVTTKLSCRWSAVMQGNASYTVSSDNLYCLQSSAAANDAITVDDLFEAMVEGENLGWVMAQDSSDECGTVGGPDTSKPHYFGEAAITSLSIVAGNNEICTSSITLTGSGEPKKGGA